MNPVLFSVKFSFFWLTTQILRIENLSFTTYSSRSLFGKKIWGPTLTYFNGTGKRGGVGDGEEGDFEYLCGYETLTIPF